jgi:hypothetical protein
MEMACIRQCSHANCATTFSTAEEYIAHARLHDGGKNSIIFCPYSSCEKRYVWAKTIARHVKDDHSGVAHPYALPQDQGRNSPNDELSFNLTVDYYCKP